MEDSLGSLIQRLRELSITKSDKVRNIRDLQGLIRSLEELQSIVGHYRLKQSIANQTMYLIDMMSKSDTRQSVMMNTLIYGPPGVGKTTVGRILAKIWYNLGYLYGSGGGSIGKSHTAASTAVTTDPLTYVSLAVFIGYCIIILGNSMSKFVYKEYGRRGMLVMVITLLVLYGVIVFYISHRYNPSEVVTQHSVSNSSSNDSIFRVVSRSDFVGKYIGHTAPITRKLLESSLGKALFIDEAYTLVNDDRDSFGKEALDQINLFLSQHPNDIVIIMAGYKDKMEKLFQYQQGLQRRFLWKFECDGYTPEELVEILQLQLNRDNGGWRISPQVRQDLISLIADNYDIFTDYGGDTEKLLFYAKIEYSKRVLYEDQDVNIGQLTILDFYKALDILRDNKVTTTTDGPTR